METTNTQQYDTVQLVLTDVELKSSSPYQWLERRITAEVAERLLRHFELIVVYKLHTTVADERAAFEKWTGYTEDALSRDAGDGYCIKGVDNQWRAWKASRAVRASAPVAGEVDDLVTALARCRDVFPMPDTPGSSLDLLWQEAMSDPLAVPAYVQACSDKQPGEMI